MRHKNKKTTLLFQCDINDLLVTFTHFFEPHWSALTKGFPPSFPLQPHLGRVPRAKARSHLKKGLAALGPQGFVLHHHLQQSPLLDPSEA